MIDFKNYTKKRDLSVKESDFDSTNIENGEIIDLFKTVWNRYKEEFTDFFEELSKKNDDIDLTILLKKLTGKHQLLPVPSYGHDNRDVVSPNMADGAAGEGEGKGE